MSGGNVLTGEELTGDSTDSWQPVTEITATAISGSHVVVMVFILKAFSLWWGYSYVFEALLRGQEVPNRDSGP